MTPRAALRAALRACFVEAGAFTWFAAREAFASRDEGAAKLRRTLYLHWYRSGAAEPARSLDAPPRDLAFIAQLTHATTALSALGARWFLERVPGAVLFEGPLELPSEGRLRIYWHLSPAAAPDFARALGAALLPHALAWRLKLLDTPAAFGRCDTAVLFTPVAAAPRVAALLAPVYERFRPSLGVGTASWTLRLAEGLSAALDPGHGESFGEQRCRLLGQALLAAPSSVGSRVVTLRQREAAVRAALAAAHVDVDAPWSPAAHAPVFTALSAAFAPTLTARVWPRVGARPLAMARAALRDEAARVARGVADRLCQEVLPVPALGAPTAGPPGDDDGAVVWLTPSAWCGGEREWVPLPARLYDGVAGVALFLAVAARHFAAPELAALARRAAHTALAQVDERALLDDTFLGGWPGVLWSAHTVAHLLRDDALSRHVRARTQRCLSHAPGTGEPRQSLALTDGLAGALWGDLALAGLVGASPLVSQRAHARASALARAARAADALASLPDTLGHGRAGVSWALSRYARTALLAPRIAGCARLSASTGTRAERLTGPAGWCNGALGRLLSRRQDEAAGDVAVGLCRGLEADERRTLVREALALARGPDPSLGLCHGLGGWLLAWSTAQPADAAPDALMCALLSATVRSLDATPAALQRPGLYTGATGAGLGLLAFAGAPVDALVLLGLS